MLYLQRENEAHFEKATACSFLVNSANKQQSIKMLTCHLENECKVCHDQGDADFLIEQKVVESASLMDTAVVDEDTDLLTLLC